jgi:hypothetical protein
MRGFGTYGLISFRYSLMLTYLGCQLSQKLFHSIVFFIKAEIMQKYEKELYLDLEERSLVRCDCQIYVTDMTEEQATSFLRTIVENQSPVRICVLPSDHVIV